MYIFYYTCRVCERLERGLERIFFFVLLFRYKKKKRTPIASGIELGGRNNYFFFPDLLRPKFHMRENGNSHIVVGMMIQLFL